MTTGWQTFDDDPDDGIAGPRPFLVSLHFLRAALIRRWRLCVSLGCTGMVVALAWTVLVPPPSEATASLYLAHESDADPGAAMATDVALLSTRSVAQSVIDDLGLDMTVEDFQSSLTANAVTSQVLTVTVTAPDDAAASARTDSLTSNFLDFRSEQIRSQSAALIDSYRQRISDLRDEADTLADDDSSAQNGTSDELDESDDPSTTPGSLTQRSRVSDEIDELAQSIATVSLDADSVARASHVVDSTRVVPQSRLRRSVLGALSGLVAGLGVGVGYVLFTALTSDRLRRRGEVAVALGAPVRFGVGPVRHRRWWAPWRPRIGLVRDRDLEILVNGLSEALGLCAGRPARLVVAALGPVEAAEQAVSAFALRLAKPGTKVTVVDLSDSGRMSEVLGTVEGTARLTTAPSEGASVEARDADANGLGIQGPSATSAPTIIRPAGLPSLARGPAGDPADVDDESEGDSFRRRWNAADVVLVLAEIDPAIGCDHLKTWADDAVVLVTAGRSNAEQLQTTADLLRAARLNLRFAIVSNTDRTDDTFGVRDSTDAFAELTRARS